MYHSLSLTAVIFDYLSAGESSARPGYRFCACILTERTPPPQHFKSGASLHSLPLVLGHVSDLGLMTLEKENGSGRRREREKRNGPDKNN